MLPGLQTSRFIAEEKITRTAFFKIRSFKSELALSDEVNFCKHRPIKQIVDQESFIRIFFSVIHVFTSAKRML